MTPAPAQPPEDDDSSEDTPRDSNADDQVGETFALDSGEDHPLSAYDIGCDEGTWNAFLRKMWCAAQAFPFALGKWFISIGTEVLSWALEFRVADALTPLATTLSRAYDTSFIDELDIRTLAWTLAVFIAGIHLLRARLADGVREIATTFVIAALGVFVLANPQGYLRGSVELAQNGSGAVLESVDSALTNHPDEDARAIRERLGGVLQRSFIAEPYDLINWGQPLSGRCAEARDQILRGGPWGGDDEPREIMREHGCEDRADFNARATDNRAISAFTVAVASGLVTILMVVLALAVFVAQITLLVLFAGVSVAWAVALFPGARSILWWWISRLVWAVLVTFTSVFLLSWIALTITVVLESTADISIVQRSTIAVLIVAVAFKFRSSIDKAIDGASSRLAGMMGRATSGAKKPGAAPAAAASGGFRAMSWSPASTAVAAATVGGATANRAIKASRRGAESSRAVGSGAVRGTRKVGTGVAKGAKAVAMAPVRIPERYAKAKARSTERAASVRDRLDHARTTRAQWLRNARHPVNAMRDAKAGAAKTAADTYDWM